MAPVAADVEEAVKEGGSFTWLKVNSDVEYEARCLTMKRNPNEAAELVRLCEFFFFSHEFYLEA